MSYTLAYTGAEIDALLGKIDAIFVAEYGSTIYSEVTAAIAADNKVIVANAGKVYVYAGQDDNSGYVFTQSGPNAAKPNATYVTLSTGNVWSTATVDLATVQQFYASLMEDTASGSIASFPDGAENVPVKELTAEITPIQDLHGQANPWPAGGGKNKLNPNGPASVTDHGVTYTKNSDGSITAQNAATSTSFYNVATNLTLPAGTYILTGGKNANRKIYAVTGSSYSTDIGSGATFTTDGTKTYRVTIEVVSGQDFSSGETFYPMIRLSTEADATFAPYSNICPILGFTGAIITVTGNNLFNGNVTQNKAMSLTGPYNSNGMGYTARIPVKPNEDYYVYGVAGYNQHRGVIFYDADDNPISTIAGVAGTGPTYRAFTTPANCASIIINFMLDTIGVSARLCVGDDDGYAPYNPDSTVYSVSWSDEAGTVYGSTINVVSGELRVTWTKDTYDGTESWTKASGTQGFYRSCNMVKREDYIGTIICDKLPTFYNNLNAEYLAADYGVTGYRDPNNNYPNENWLYLKAGGATTVAELRAWLAANPVTVVYELATPQTYQLTPTEVKTLLGQNNIWSNTGDISVKYRCNTALYIEKKLG